MRRTVGLLCLLVLVSMMPLADALAQSTPARGAVHGAILGGALGGRRGAAIGAAAGAIAGSHHSRHHWQSPYYWHHGRCWVRSSHGSHPVHSRYCH
jgi:uncharacterized protein YcfJ